VFRQGVTTTPCDEFLLRPNLQRGGGVDLYRRCFSKSSPPIDLYRRHFDRRYGSTPPPCRFRDSSGDQSCFFVFLASMVPHKHPTRITDTKAFLFPKNQLWAKMEAYGLLCGWKDDFLKGGTPSVYATDRVSVSVRVCVCVYAAHGYRKTGETLSRHGPVTASPGVCVCVCVFMHHMNTEKRAKHSVQSLFLWGIETAK